MSNQDAKGRFTKGNALGKHSKPHASKVQALRTRMFKVVTPKAFEEVVRMLLITAIDRRVPAATRLEAARIILDRCLGPAEAVDVLERLELLEHELSDDDAPPLKLRA